MLTYRSAFVFLRRVMHRFVPCDSTVATHFVHIQLPVPELMANIQAMCWFQNTFAYLCAVYMQNLIDKLTLLVCQSPYCPPGKQSYILKTFNEGKVKKGKMQHLHLILTRQGSVKSGVCLFD